MQSLLVLLILAACIAYTARRLWKRFTTKREDDLRCAGCPLADTCHQRHEDITTTCHHPHTAHCCH